MKLKGIKEPLWDFRLGGGADKNSIAGYSQGKKLN